jgi:crotonobetainyl-CoA:carnitine CoA-transferase CaiB-like acyl-CoA transferase
VSAGDQSPGPLAGVRVIDAGQVVAGPMIAMLLGDFGAEVIKIEQPGRGDPYRTFSLRKEGVPLAWKVLARNKKSITLDLSHPRGAELLRGLVTQADVLVESFRPDTVERWGFGYEALSQLNPRLVMVMVSGFGQSGPYRDRPGFGSIVEAMSGFAQMTGEPDGPPTLPPFPLADSVAALYGAYGVMTCLYNRDVSGEAVGQCIDLSLVEPLFSILGPLATLFDQLGSKSKRLGNRIAMTAPRNAYRTKDDHWVAIAGSVQKIAENTLRAVGREDLIRDPRFATNESRVANAEELDAIIGAWMQERTREEALEILLSHEVAAGPVMDIEDIMNDPHFAARNAIPTVDDPELGPFRMQGILPSLSRTPGQIHHAGPRLGEHNAEIYGELLGLSGDDLAELRAANVI